MENFDLEKGLKILESVQSSENFKKSLEIVEQSLNESLVSSFLLQSKCIYSNEPSTWKYSCHIFYLLDNIRNHVDLNTTDKSKMLNMSQMNAVVHAIQECSVYGLDVCVKKHQNRFTYNTTSINDQEYQRLTSCLRMFRKFFDVKLVSSNSLFDDSKLDYMIGILATISLKKNPEDTSEFVNVFSNISSTFNKELVFKFIMMMRGFMGFSKEFQLLTHRELMKMICGPNGFLILCKNLLVKPDDSQIPLWQKLSMISKIIEAVASNKSRLDFIIDEIFKTLESSIQKEERDIVGACVYVLKNLEGKSENKDLVHSKILKNLDDLVQPDVLLTGSIVMENNQLVTLINQFHALFSPSTVASLPSKILQKHIAVLFNLYSIIPESNEKTKLASLIIFFLSNRDRQELQKVVQDLRLKDNPKALKLHPRICFKNDSLQIDSESEKIPDDTEQFLLLLKDSNNNFLIYDAFLCLINILGSSQSSSDSFLSEYNVQEEDLPDVLHRKFFKKLAILEPLQEMIQWRSLHSQLNEKPKEILDAVKKVLEKTLEKPDSMDEHLLIIFFSIFKELMGRLKDDDQRQQMKKEFLKIKDKCKDPKLKAQIETIFDVSEEVPNIDPSKIAFEDAVKLMKSKEIYCKVYGSDTLIKLLKKRDSVAVLNRHTILALALQNLRETESYAYLNVIRLLVALSNVMDTEVVDALISDFQNQELEIDERLKIGEVIIKVTEDLGQMSFKFKDQLIKCFLSGSCDKNDEFRTSSLANLGTICKTLSYQVHSFFNEMFLQLEIIIKSDEYLPSKRAAAMVLSQILAGLPNLMEFQDFLLPIYHLLKEILANEVDDQTKLHAQVGLDHLNAKTKDFLNPKLDVAKEIKIVLDKNPNKIEEIKFK